MQFVVRGPHFRPSPHHCALIMVKYAPPERPPHPHPDQPRFNKTKVLIKFVSPHYNSWIGATATMSGDNHAAPLADICRPASSLFVRVEKTTPIVRPSLVPCATGSAFKVGCFDGRHAAFPNSLCRNEFAAREEYTDPPCFALLRQILHIFWCVVPRGTFSSMW